MSNSARRYGIPLTLRNPDGEHTDILISSRPGNAGEIVTSARRQLPPLGAAAGGVSCALKCTGSPGSGTGVAE
jgi:hypothetical protein